MFPGNTEALILAHTRPTQAPMQQLASLLWIQSPSQEEHPVR
jgi:hypothetical protein